MGRIVRRAAATVLTVVAAAGLAAFASAGSFEDDDPFPHSVLAPVEPGGSR